MGLNIATIAVSGGEPVAGDSSTQLIVERLAAAGHRIVQQGTVDDSVQRIRAKLLELIADAGIDVVIVTADLKTESCGVALDPLVTRGLHGFSDLLRMIAYQEIGSAAMLVDAEAAQCKSTFVFILPASIESVKLALEKLLIPQLDYRTRPRNLAMDLPRLARVSDLEAVPSPMPIVDTQRAVPWIVPRTPGTPPAPPPARPGVQTAQRKSLAIAAAQPSPSESVRMVLAKAATGLSINEMLPTSVPADGLARKEPTNVGAPPPPPPPATRAKINSTLPNPLSIKPPARLIPLAELLPVSAEAAAAAVDPLADNVPKVMVANELSGPVEPPREMASLADLDDEGDDLDEVPSDVAEIVNEPPPAIAALFDQPPRRERGSIAPATLPPRRTDDTFDDSPRRFAEPRQPRRDRRTVALVLLGITLVAATTVLAVGIARRQGHEAAAAGDAYQNDLVATRDVMPSADLSPPAPPPEATQPTEPDPTPPTDVVTVANPPSEIDMSAPPADSGVAAAPMPAKSPRSPRTRRDPLTAPVSDPADVLASAPVSKVDEGCDEVSCILDKYRQPCCAALKPPEPENDPVVEKPSSGLPEKLDKLMVREGMSAVKPAVIACGEQFPSKGTVKISVKVSGSGRIVKASVASSPDPALGACVAAAVKLAKFPETDDGGSFAYPFAF